MVVTSAQLLRQLYGFYPRAIDLSMGRLQTLLHRMGNPQKQLPAVVHIAGTNGKGSTATFVKTFCELLGLRVHSYTSPHLMQFHERITLADRQGHSKNIEEAMLCALLQECQQKNGDNPITFFEITTVVALMAFSKVPADVVIVEVGLGGRLDATNVVENVAVSVVTPVALDHQNYLGTTLQKIAAEKAGIFRTQVPAVMAPQKRTAHKVLEEIARQKNTPLWRYNKEWKVKVLRGKIIYQCNSSTWSLPLPAMQGSHQVENAAVAMTAVKLLCEKMPEVTFTEEKASLGLTSAFLSGRFHRLTQGKLVGLLPHGGELWLDGAHNPAGARVLAKALKQTAAGAFRVDETKAPWHMILGMKQDKNARAFLQAVGCQVSTVTMVPLPTDQDNPSMDFSPPEDLCAMAKALGMRAFHQTDVRSALESIVQRHGAPRIIICGSLYLLGAVLWANQS